MPAMAGGGNGFWRFIVLYTARTLSDSGDNLGELLLSEPTLVELVGVKAKPCTDEEAEEVVETDGDLTDFAISQIIPVNWSNLASRSFIRPSLLLSGRKFGAVV
jgi:hypothetical protein